MRTRLTFAAALLATATLTTSVARAEDVSNDAIFNDPASMAQLGRTVVAVHLCAPYAKPTPIARDMVAGFEQNYAELLNSMSDEAFMAYTIEVASFRPRLVAQIDPDGTFTRDEQNRIICAAQVLANPEVFQALTK